MENCLQVCPPAAPAVDDHQLLHTNCRKKQGIWDLGTHQNQDNEIYNNIDIDIKIKPRSDSKVAADVALQTSAEEPWSTPLTHI